jgi:cell division protein FtsB
MAIKNEIKKKISFAIVLFALGIILAVMISIRAIQEAYRSREIEKEVEDLKKEAERIQAENDAIQQKIEYYDTSRFVEKVSKDKINMQKPDEKVVIVNQNISQPNTQVKIEQKEIVEMEPIIPNYNKWWNFFFKPL